jgi:thiol-disulfide isomerase/thioredoxin
VAIDSQSQKEILIGNCNIQGLNSGEFARIFWDNYSSYLPDTLVMAKFKTTLKDIRFKIIMGSWCGDSKDQVPRFFKVLDMLKYNPSEVEILCFSRQFKDKEIEAKRYDIKKIPTIIIYRNNTEIGRIIETPHTTLEKDLLDILNMKTSSQSVLN